MLIRRKSHPSFASSLLRANSNKEWVIRLNCLQATSSSKITVNGNLSRFWKFRDILFSAFTFTTKTVAPAVPASSTFINDGPLLDVSPAQAGNFFAAACRPEVEQENSTIAQSLHSVGRNNSKETIELFIGESTIRTIRTRMTQAKSGTGSL